jgi:hypothetical protein
MSLVFGCQNTKPGCMCLECQWRWEVQGIEALMMRGMTRMCTRCGARDLHVKPIFEARIQ